MFLNFRVAKHPLSTIFQPPFPRSNSKKIEEVIGTASSFSKNCLGIAGMHRQCRYVIQLEVCQIHSMRETMK